MDQLRGCMFGSALADAIGLITEFKHKGEITEIKFPYEYSVRGWDPNDWTDDTDQMILLLQLITNNNLTQKTFAQKILNWSQYGFKELGDTVGMGLGGSTTMVLRDPDFLKYPERVSQRVWVNGGCALAPNGSLMRCAILSFTDNPIGNSIRIGKVTHVDPRCIASCIVLNAAICLIRDGDTSDLASVSMSFGLRYLQSISKTTPCASKQRGIPKIWVDSNYSSDKGYDYGREMYDTYIDSENLCDLKLDEIGKIGYVYKCLGCAFWAMRQIEQLERIDGLDYLDLIKQIALEAGDADTNATVAGSLFGTYLGYAELYKQTSVEIDAMPNTKWLMDIINLSPKAPQN
jgi:ADP-ribosylglycohydrolase